MNVINVFHYCNRADDLILVDNGSKVRMVYRRRDLPDGDRIKMETQPLARGENPIGPVICEKCGERMPLDYRCKVCLACRTLHECPVSFDELLRLYYTLGGYRPVVAYLMRCYPDTVNFSTYKIRGWLISHPKYEPLSHSLVSRMREERKSK